MSRVQFRKLDVHHESMYEKEIADEIFDLLKTVELNSDEESQVHIYGKWINIPRRQTAFGDEGTSYTFSGNTVPAKPWTPWLEAIRQNVAIWLVDNIPEIFAVKDAPSPLPNFVLVNQYRNGKDYIGPHSDDEKDLKGFTHDAEEKSNNNKKITETIIVSLSFGATREFLFQSKAVSLVQKQFSLENGDICVMRGETQKYWKHSVPKKAKCKDMRFNLTFRFM